MCAIVVDILPFRYPLIVLTEGVAHENAVSATEWRSCVTRQLRPPGND